MCTAGWLAEHEVVLSPRRRQYASPRPTSSQPRPAPAPEEEEAAPGEDKVVTYVPRTLQRDLIRVRKGLHLYNSNLKVYRALDGKNLLFEDGTE